MKKLFIFLTILLLFIIGCANNKQKNLIESFLSTSDGVVSDLKFKMINLEEKSPITATDSMICFTIGIMPIKYTWVGDSIKGTYLDEDGTSNNFTFIKSSIDTMITLQINYKKSSLKHLEEINDEIHTLEIEKIVNDNPYMSYNSFINEYEDLRDDLKDRIENETEPAIQKLKLAKKYSQIPTETILLRTFDCTYSIFNPILQVKQTQTRTFYFNNELTKIIK